MEGKKGRKAQKGHMFEGLNDLPDHKQGKPLENDGEDSHF